MLYIYICLYCKFSLLFQKIAIDQVNPITEIFLQHFLAKYVKDGPRGSPTGINILVGRTLGKIIAEIMIMISPGVTLQTQTLNGKTAMSPNVVKAKFLFWGYFDNNHYFMCTLYRINTFCSIPLSLISGLYVLVRK